MFSGRLAGRFVVMVAALFGGLLLAVTPADAATLVVNTTADGSSSCPSTCTLRGALAAANPGDTITFALNGTVLLNSTLTLTKDVTITGPGAAGLIIDGQNTVRVFQVDSGVTAQISGVTVQHGTANGGRGGGIANNGTLTITDSVIRDNRAPGDGGGGIANNPSGTLTVSKSTFTGNTAGGGGGIDNLGALTVIATTLTGNTADAGGGIADGNHAGTSTVTNSTLSNNRALGTAGDQLWVGFTTLSLINSTVVTTSGSNSIFANAGTAQLRNSIVVGTGPVDACATQNGGVITSLGNNLSNKTGCFDGTSMGNIVSPTLGLGLLAMNAPGTTMTHALLPGSPAIDGVTYFPTDCPGSPVTDQRGVPRPQARPNARCDIGAFELTENTPPTVTPITTQSTNEDTPSEPIGFTIGDAQSLVGGLTVTATSGDEGVVPNSGIELGGGTGGGRWIRLTPLPNVSGSTIIDIAVKDDLTTTHTSFMLTVLPVNDPPVAANDSYSMVALSTLTTTSSTRVLANDLDVDSNSNSLTAVLVQGPAHGTLNMQSDGRFTYAPVSNFAGTDSFTYRASDGTSQSNPATVTITVTASACAPRPTVRPQPTAAGGKLQVHVESTPLTTQQNNPLRELRFGTMQNAKVILNGQEIASGQTYIAPANVIAVDFTVERLTAGQAATVPFSVVDGCGEWKTFVGGGAGAGF